MIRASKRSFRVDGATLPAVVTFGTVKVEGTSMLPTYFPGECLVVLWGGRPAAGRVVIAERADGTLLIKRAVRCDEQGWWLEGDNAEASSDSRRLGPFWPEKIKGRVLFRYRPLFRRRAGAGS